MKKVLFILGQLSDADADWIARTGRRARHAAGTELIRYGVPTAQLHFILDGEVAVLTPRRFELARLGAGEILGEMSLVDSRPPSASAVVVQDAYVLSVDKAVLGRKLESDPAFAARLYRAIAIFLSERMRSTVGRMGYGDDTADPAAEDDVDDLDANVLDHVHLAGARFERLLQRLMG